MSGDELVYALKNIREDLRVPALAAATIIKGELCDIAAVGKRRIDGQELVTINDKWHIGSCTKPMTATLAGILVERKQIDWNTCVADVFGNWRLEIDSAWLGVTLEQLLSHRGGAPESPPNDLWQQAWKQIGTPTNQRIDFVKGLLIRAPHPVPDTKCVYSNQGYAIAGLMLETCTGRDWETLIEELVFRPLSMDSSGFGAPGSAQLCDQPWGHTRSRFRLKSVVPGPGADNPAAIAPGGAVHCSIEDLAKFAASHAGRNCLVTRETLDKLHRPLPASDYSLGWYVTHRDWGGGDVFGPHGIQYDVVCKYVGFAEKTSRLCCSN